MTDPRYPIGKFDGISPSSVRERDAMVQGIAETPARLRDAVRGLSLAQIATPYRDGGWTLRQVVHHLPDSHMNAYVRFKLGLTEDFPTIKPYMEARWAELEDSRSAPIEVSLSLLESLHARWVMLMQAMQAEEWARKLNHPEDGVITLERMVAIYHWHGRHHVAQITSLRERNGW